MATTDIGIDRPLPANLDAERFVLGAIMVDDSAFLQAAGRFRPKISAWKSISASFCG